VADVLGGRFHFEAPSGRVSRKAAARRDAKTFVVVLVFTLGAALLCGALYVSLAVDILALP
jgi:hypothetical protein